MSSTRIFKMPTGGVIGTVSKEGEVQLSDAFFRFFGGLEDVSGRVSENIALLAGDTTAATMSAKIDELITALIASKQMKAE